VIYLQQLILEGQLIEELFVHELFVLIMGCHLLIHFIINLCCKEHFAA
jgi:hypothetical protein